jgi:hypothetical protein
MELTAVRAGLSAASLSAIVVPALILLTATTAAVSSAIAVAMFVLAAFIKRSRRQCRGSFRNVFLEFLKQLIVFFEHHSAEGVALRCALFVNLGQKLFRDRSFSALFNLFCSVDRDVAKAKHLATQSALIDVITGADQAQLFARRRIHVPIPIENFHSAFRARRHTVAGRANWYVVLVGQVHDRLTLFDIQFHVLWQKFNFHHDT